MKSECHIAAFYRFVDLGTTKKLAEDLIALCSRLEIKGTIILAPEGINGTVAGTQASLRKLHDDLRVALSCDALEWKQSVASKRPFGKLKIKQKAEIISLGVKGIRPQQKTGQHVDAAQWNALVQDPHTLLIDTRNAYEVALGSFPGAVDPATRTFRQFPDFIEKHLGEDKSRPVAMFCTGGIRCEKAAALVMDQGFEQVYQLNGGILRYLEEVAPDENLWEGECFVFDERLSVDAKLAPGGHEPCGNCHLPVLPEEKLQAGYEMGISCPKCEASLTPTRRRALREKLKQARLAEQRANKAGTARD